MIILTLYFNTKLNTYVRFAVGLFSFIVFISACGTQSFAQKSDTDSQLKEANKLFEEGKYSEAYPLYTQLLSLRRGDPEITFKYGATLLYGAENKAEAISYLKKASLKSGMDIRCFYFLGKAYHLNYKFDHFSNVKVEKHYLVKLKMLLFLIEQMWMPTTFSAIMN